MLSPFILQSTEKKCCAHLYHETQHVFHHFLILSFDLKLFPLYLDLHRPHGHRPIHCFGPNPLLACVLERIVVLHPPDQRDPEKRDPLQLGRVSCNSISTALAKFNRWDREMGPNVFKLLTRPLIPSRRPWTKHPIYCSSSNHVTCATSLLKSWMYSSTLPSYHKATSCSKTLPSPIPP